MAVLATGQLTILVETAVVQDSAPDNPALNLLWTDTSATPSVTKRWTGTNWEIVNDTSDLDGRVAAIEDGITAKVDLSALIAYSTTAEIEAAIAAAAAAKVDTAVLARYLQYNETEGLVITAPNAPVYMALTEQQLDFRKPAGEGYAVVATYGALHMVSPPLIQVGQNGQLGKIRIGGLALEAQSNGDVVIRKR